MKKVLASLLVFVMLLVMVPVGALSVSASEGVFNGLYYEIYNDEVTITGYEDGETLPKHLIIPAVIEGYPVTGVDGFTYCPVTAVTFPDTLTSIGYRAFDSCPNLKEVFIPAGVTGISYGAFANCSSLTAITVDASNAYYYSVDGVLFDRMRSILQLYPAGKAGNYVIPDGILGIDDLAFYGCSELTSLSIPGSLSKIRSYSFVECDSLVDITVEATNSYFCSVDGVLFSKDMTSLIRYPSDKGESRYTIPEGVKYIWPFAFSGCYKDLRFLAFPDSVLDIYEYAFFYTWPDYVYYIGSKEQWEQIYINDSYYGSTSMPGYDYLLGGGNINLLKASFAYNSTMPIEVEDHEHIIKVVDSAGKRIRNAKVQLMHSGSTFINYTDKSGYVKFDKFSIGGIDFTVTADGYVEYTTVGKNFELSDSGLDVVVLYTAEEAKYKLTEAIYQDTDASYNERIGKDINLVQGTKRLSLSNKEINIPLHPTVATGYFRILCSTADPSQVKGYILYQNDKRIAVSLDGTFNLKIGDFEAGKNIYVAVYSEDGKTVNTPLNLEICDDTKIKHFNVSFGDSISIKVPENFPFVGGDTLSCKIPKMPLQFKFENGKLYAGLNVNFTEDESIEEQFDKLTQTMMDVRKLADYKVGKKLEGNITKFLKSREKFNLPMAGDVDVILFGGGQLTWTNNGLDDLQIQSYLLVDFSGKKNWQTAVWVIPVTIQLKVGIEGKVEAILNWNFETETLNGDVEVNLKPNITVFGGVGVSEFIGVGAYGEAEADFGIQLIGTTTAPGLKYVDLTGELGLKAYAGPFIYEKPFGYRTWHIYTRTDMQSYLCYSPAARRYYGSIYSSANYSLDDASYLANKSAWFGEWSIHARSYSAGVADGGISIRPLIFGAYRNVQPSVAASKDDAVMVYIDAGVNKDYPNYPTVMYSVYNAIQETWSEPVQVDNNRTLDATPTIFSNGQTIRMAYQDAAVVYDDELSQEEYLGTQNISVYVYDSSTDKFVVEKTFTPSGEYYRAPKLTEVNGVPTLVWISGRENDILGQGGNNTILCSSYQNGAWSEPIAFAQNICTISDYAVGEVNDRLHVLYAADSDNDLSTEEDRNLVLTSAAGSQTISEGVVSNVDFAKLPSESAYTFVWIADEMLYSLTNAGKAKQACYIGAPESIVAMEDKILFTAACKNEEGNANSEIYAVVYDEETCAYGAPVQISKQDRYIERLSGATFKGTEFIVMTRKEVTIEEDSWSGIDVDDDCEFAWAVLSDMSKLQLDSVEYDYADMENGQIPLYIAVSNQGAAAADGYTVSVKDSDDNMIAQQRFNDSLLAGESRSVVVMMPLDNVTEIADYTVTIGESSESESDTKVMTIGYADLSVSSEIIKVGNQNTLVSTVVNNGLSEAYGTLIVYEDTPDNFVSAISVSGLAPGESKSIVVDVANVADERVLTSEVISDFEYSDANNMDSVYADFSVCAEAECQHDYQITTIEPTCDKEGKLTYACSLCGYAYSEVVPATGIHTYDSICDDACNQCGAVREIPYIYEGINTPVNIATGGQSVEFVFVPSETGMYQFYSTGNSDTLGYILDADGIEIVCDDESGSGNNFQLTCELIAGVPYILGSRYWSDSSTGSFVICVRQSLDEFSLNYEIVNDEVIITGYNGIVPNGLMIPSTIEGYPVTTIGMSAFEMCETLTAVTVPDSVTQIEPGAFQMCFSLRSVDIGDGVESIGAYAFAYCDLSEVLIPSRVVAVAEGAFAGCDNLTSITVSETNPNYCSVDGVLFDKEKTTLVQYPSGKSGTYTILDGVANIATAAFANCSGLTMITIPNSVVAIGDMAFFGCNNLTSIVIPNSVTNLGNSPFAYCDKLTAFTVVADNPNYCSVDGILFNKDQTVLIQYPSAKEASRYIVPSGVVTIAENAFMGCSKLEYVDVTADAQTIGYQAFSSCSSLVSIKLGENITSIDAYAFAGCVKLKDMVIPDGVIAIYEGTFLDCDSLTSLTIGKGVTLIEYWVFEGCFSLSDVYYSGSEEQKESINISTAGNDTFIHAAWHYDCVPTPDVPVTNPGDVNGDSKVNNRDLGILQQYLNGWDVGVNVDASDVTGDGKINNRDLGILQQHLNGWDVELK